MQPRHFEAIIFSLKAALAAVIAVVCYEDFGLPGAGWSAISSRRTRNRCPCGHIARHRAGR